MDEHPLTKAARAVGTKAALARKVGVSPQAVQKWMTTRVPAERVLDIERASGVSRHELRPDLYPQTEVA